MPATRKAPWVRGKHARGGRCGDRAIAAYRELQDEGKLTARVSIAFTPPSGVQSCATLKRDLDSFDFSQFTDRDWLDCRTIKLFCDGVPTSHTAWMNQDYADRPGYRGRSVFGGPGRPRKHKLRRYSR